VPEEKIKIKCTKCAAVFRERGSRIRSGFQLNCPQCNRLITFDASSEDVNVRKAFQAAKAFRYAHDVAQQAERAMPAERR
jgi:predicted  nucleic acid-binding Zn-ribbon protein